jgi:hypothetical protein
MSDLCNAKGKAHLEKRASKAASGELPCWQDIARQYAGIVIDEGDKYSHGEIH